MLAIYRKPKLAWALALALGVTGPASWADDAGLYGDAVPADAAFFRVLAEYPNHEAPIVFAGVDVSSAKDHLDNYVAISAASLGDVKAGTYFSIAGGPGGAMTIQEPDRDTATKVHLILLNTGSSDVRLVVPSKGLEVVAALQPGQSASRAVNPIEIDLAVERVDDGTRLGTFDVSLARGRNLTFIAGQASARMIENSVSHVLTSN